MNTTELLHSDLKDLDLLQIRKMLQASSTWDSDIYSVEYYSYQDGVYFYEALDESDDDIGTIRVWEQNGTLYAEYQIDQYH